MSGRDRSGAVRFVPGQGLIEGKTVKEFVAGLLAEGFFDDATAIVLFVSGEVRVESAFSGNKWECMALSNALKERMMRRYLDDR